MKKSTRNKQGALSNTDRTDFLRRVALVAACIGFLACQVETDQQALKELQEGQKTILERIDKVEKAQKEFLTAWNKRFPQKRQMDYNKVHDLKVGKSPVRGAKDAKVTLVEFSDIQCPYSRRAQPLIQKLLEAYPEDLQHVFKNFPLRFHKRALPAAKACVAAGMQGKFWEMEQLVFKNPKELEDDHLKKYAGEIGLDIEKYEKDFRSQEVQKQVDEDIAEAQKAGVTGTPTLFLNGKRVRNRSEEEMKKEIQAILDMKKKT